MILLSILAFIVIFSLLIIIHEFGHYYAAIKSGVKVEEFGLGMGKKLASIKRGETEFTLNAVPFGGFVRMLGEESNSKDKRSFGMASLPKRMIITLAGVFMNFIFAIVALTLLFSVGTNPILVSDKEMKQAYESGLVIFELPDGTQLKKPEAKIWAQENPDIELKAIYTQQIQKPLPQAFTFAIKETFRISGAVLEKAAEIPRDLITKLSLPEGMAGPVGIAEITHKVIPLGFLALVKLTALLSISLGVMNLLPVPALDGGRFLFQIVEMLGKPFKLKVNETLENYVHVAGYIFLMGLLLLITWNDIMRLF